VTDAKGIGSNVCIGRHGTNIARNTHDFHSVSNSSELSGKGVLADEFDRERGSTFDIQHVEHAIRTRLQVEGISLQSRDGHPPIATVQ